MGKLHIRKDGKVYEVNDRYTGAKVKEMLKLPSDSILINAKNEIIRDDEPVGNKVKEGERIGAKPRFRYW